VGLQAAASGSTDERLPQCMAVSTAAMVNMRAAP
jgi:hypothetical protein